jgi:hypothetical protein
MMLHAMKAGFLFVLATSNLPQYQAASSVPDSETSLTGTSLRSKGNHRQLQFSNGNKCGVTGFSIYNSVTLIWEPLASVVINELPHAQLVLENYSPDQEINIQTHVDTSGCAAIGRPSTIGCVKMRMFNSTDYFDYSPPYTLYQPTAGVQVETKKPAKTGFQHFNVELYETSRCTGTLICDDKLFINFVSTARKSMNFGSLRATYSGLTSIPSIAHGQQVQNATCRYIKRAIQNGLIVPGSSLEFSEDDWACQAGSITNKPPAMTYSFKVLFKTSSMISVYDNSPPPTVANITSFVHGLFKGNKPGLYNTETMMEYLKKPSTGLTSNPYWNSTSISVTTSDDSSDDSEDESEDESDDDSEDD